MVDFAAARYKTCKACEHFNKIMKSCRICSCFMPAKTLIKGAYCPATPPRWLALAEPAPDSNCCKGNNNA